MATSLTSVGEHLKRCGDRAVTVTVPLIRYWWRRLNLEVFDGKLHEHDFFVEDLGNACAQCDGEDIWINSRCATRTVLIGSIAHEMIHQLQWLRSRPLDHGRFFQSHARRLYAALGVPIV